MVTCHVVLPTATGEFRCLGLLHEAPDWESMDLTSRVSDRHGQFTRHVSEFLISVPASWILRFSLLYVEIYPVFILFTLFLFYFSFFILQLVTLYRVLLFTNYLYSHQLPSIPVSNIYNIPLPHTNHPHKYTKYKPQLRTAQHHTLQTAKTSTQQPNPTLPRTIPHSRTS